MIKENTPSVPLEFPCTHCSTQTSGTLLSSTTSDWWFTAFSYITRFQSCCKMWICRLRFINCSPIMVLHHIYGAAPHFMVHALWCSTTFMVRAFWCSTTFMVHPLRCSTTLMFHALWCCTTFMVHAYWCSTTFMVHAFWCSNTCMVHALWCSTTYVVHALWCSTTFYFCSSAKLEPTVSVPMESMTWNNNMAHPLT